MPPPRAAVSAIWLRGKSAFCFQLPCPGPAPRTGKGESCQVGRCLFRQRVYHHMGIQLLKLNPQEPPQKETRHPHPLSFAARVTAGSRALFLFLLLPRPLPIESKISPARIGLEFFDFSPSALVSELGLPSPTAPSSTRPALTLITHFWSPETRNNFCCDTSALAGQPDAP